MTTTTSSSTSRIGLFQELKTAQLAAYLLFCIGGSASTTRFMHLLYLTFRDFLDNQDTLIIEDDIAIIENGIILVRTYELIIDEDRTSKIWSKLIVTNFDKVSLIHPELERDNFSELSIAYVDLVQKIFNQFGDWSETSLTEYIKTLPEWNNAQKAKNTTIPITDLFTALGRTPEQMIDIVDELEFDAGWILDEIRREKEREERMKSHD